MTEKLNIDLKDDENIDEIYEKHKLNKNQWQLTHLTFNEWTTPFKDDDGIVTPFVNTQKKATFRKIIQDITLDIIKNQYELMGNTNEFFEFNREKYKTDESYLYEISVADHHFGKLAWSEETDEDYDLEIAKKLYINAIYDLLDKVKHLKISKILFPIGNDLFNFDNIIPTTTAGTFQDTDSRWQKLYKEVSLTLINILNILRTIADVDVLIVPGNHDRSTCFYLGEFLSAWFRNDKHININNSPKLRTYYKYGKTLIGFTHGSEEKHNDLPLLMAREAKQEWGTSENYEYQVGHFHRKKETKYIAGDTFNGVGVRILPSLSGTDAWHYKKGFVKGVRSAVGILYNRESGYYGEFISKI